MPEGNIWKKTVLTGLPSLTPMMLALLSVTILGLGTALAMRRQRHHTISNHR